MGENCVVMEGSNKRHKSDARLYVVLEMAPLETIKVGGEYRLINSDDHAHQLKKHNRDPANSRPDIVHQCLLALLDSPLAKAERLQIFIHTQRDILIEVNPKIRIPRTYKRFAGLMVQLLQKLSIKAHDSDTGKLMKVIKNPVSKHLPAGARRILMSPSAEKFVNIHDYVETTPKDGPTVFIIGAMAKGVATADYADESICISNYSLSAACV